MSLRTLKHYTVEQEAERKLLFAAIEAEKLAFLERIEPYMRRLAKIECAVKLSFEVEPDAA